MNSDIMEVAIRTPEEFDRFHEESLRLVLRADSPGKGQEFCLFRGVKDYSHQLISSLAREARALEDSEVWRQKIAGIERDLLNRFLKEVEPYSDRLKEQYEWFRQPEQKTETFWYLSVMQHYGAPTRLVDFTADFWTAVFFAFDDNETGKRRAIYRLKCKNEDENDRGGNKLPKNQNREPRWFGAARPDTNQLLGHLIGYGGFPPVRLEDESSGLWKDPAQVVGWDQPHFHNARLRHQRGYFVYNLDVIPTSIDK